MIQKYVATVMAGLLILSSNPAWARKGVRIRGLNPAARNLVNQGVFRGLSATRFAPESVLFSPVANPDAPFLRELRRFEDVTVDPEVQLLETLGSDGELEMTGIRGDRLEREGEAEVFEGATQLEKALAAHAEQGTIREGSFAESAGAGHDLHARMTLESPSAARGAVSGAGVADFARAGGWGGGHRAVPQSMNRIVAPHSFGNGGGAAEGPTDNGAGSKDRPKKPWWFPGWLEQKMFEKGFVFSWRRPDAEEIPAPTKKPVGQDADTPEEVAKRVANLRIPAEKLRFTQDEKDLPDSTEGLEVDLRVVGQDEAMGQLRDRLSKKREGNHLIVTGPESSGKMTGVLQVLEELSGQADPSGQTDPSGGKVYLGRPSNESDPFMVLDMGPEKAEAFEADLKKLQIKLSRAMNEATKEITRLSEEAENNGPMGRVITETMALEFNGIPLFEKVQELSLTDDRFKEWSSDEGGIRLIVVPTQQGPLVGVKMKDSRYRILSEEVFDVLLKMGLIRKGEDDEKKEKFHPEDIEQLQDLFEGVDRRLGEALREGVEEVAESSDVIEEKAKEIRKRRAREEFSILDPYAQEFPQIARFLKDLEKGISEEPNLYQDRFLFSPNIQKAREEGDYAVETSPEWETLFGAIQTQKGAPVGVTHGLLAKLDGGTLVLRAEDVFKQGSEIMDPLVRYLATGEFLLTNTPPKRRPFVSGPVYETKVKANTKIVFVSDSARAQQLRGISENRISGISFDGSMDRTPETVQGIVQFAVMSLKKLGIDKPMSSGAIAALIEFSSKLAGNQKKFTASFGRLYGLIEDAAHFAAKSAMIEREHVQKSLDEAFARDAGWIKRRQELLEKGVIHVPTSGKAVGQGVGLVVMGSGEAAIGFPALVTANVRMNQGNSPRVILTDQKAGDSMKKSVEIVEGILGAMLTKKGSAPIDVFISLEQTYGPIDGDSATGIILATALSAISGIPIDLSKAMTGSMNQKHVGQAIGGENEKAEGHFQLARTRGLDGSHGVIIPKTNAEDLQLDHEVVAAVEQGSYHVYASSNLEEALELLTGVDAKTFIAEAIKQSRIWALRQRHGAEAWALENPDDVPEDLKLFIPVVEEYED